MAFYTELPVYKDSYQLVLKVFEVTSDKEQRNYLNCSKRTIVVKI